MPNGNDRTVYSEPSSVHVLRQSAELQRIMLNHVGGCLFVVVLFVLVFHLFGLFPLSCCVFQWLFPVVDMLDALV